MMSETLRQKAERFITLESSPSRREWGDLVRELLLQMDNRHESMEKVIQSSIANQKVPRPHPFPPHPEGPSGVSEHVIVPCPSND